MKIIVTNHRDFTKPAPTVFDCCTGGFCVKVIAVNCQFFAKPTPTITDAIA
ncbi:hypothetical protein [Chroococcidiopsis sp.]|uniref:hypothetical protein n=1 Tax=Chroococcidiopsis sp. TaxID=3088168 RepID=UPI003F3E0798